MNLIEELERLNAMHSSGALSDEEFRKAKEALLNEHQSTGPRFKQAMHAVSCDDSTWGLLIHLSQFCGYLLPLAGFIVPLTLWLIKKDDSRIIDLHGRIVMNWILSLIIYGILFGLLCIILIGIPLVILLGILSFVYPIVGGVKASDGEIWSYPGSIHFLPTED